MDGSPDEMPALRRPRVDKIRLLWTIAGYNPREFVSRMANFVGARAEWLLPYASKYHFVPVQDLEPSLPSSLRRHLLEGRPQELSEVLRKESWSLGLPFDESHNASFQLALMCWALCRWLRPASVVETGVAHGVTTAFILAALDENRKGRLYSIDLPPLAPGNDSSIGLLVPPELRARWQLLRGTSRQLLRPLVEELGGVDVFVHDSLHTERNMRREFNTVLPFLGSRSAILSDDIQGNSAFAALLEARPPTCSVLAQEKKSCWGLAVYGELF